MVSEYCGHLFQGRRCRHAQRMRVPQWNLYHSTESAPKRFRVHQAGHAAQAHISSGIYISPSPARLFVSVYTCVCPCIHVYHQVCAMIDESITLVTDCRDTSLLLMQSHHMVNLFVRQHPEHSASSLASGKWKGADHQNKWAME